MKLRLCGKCKNFYSPDGEWKDIEFPCTCNHETGKIESLYVQGDIEPYKSMITGEMITSRSQHKSHMRQHNVQEAGNEQKYFMDMDKVEKVKEQDIKRREWEAKHGPISDKEFDKRKRTLQ